MMDRHLTVNLANLTGDMRQQGTSIKFNISEVNDGVGIASVVGYESSYSHLKRFVRKGVERLDDSVRCVTSDGAVVQIKPFAVTKTNTSKQKLRDIRSIIRKEMISQVRKQKYDSLIRSIIANKLQSILKTSAKKVFPLRIFVIKKMELIQPANPQLAKTETPETEEKTPDQTPNPTPKK